MHQISPTKLNLMEECPRCFYLSVTQNINRPQGIMASIVNKMDSIIKNYFNKYRKLNQLPPIIQGKVNGKLAKNIPNSLHYKYSDALNIVGIPDEYLELETGEIIPFDHKTKSKSPEEAHPSYIVQMDIYCYLLKMNNYNTTNIAYLAYYYPEDSDLHDGLDIECKIIEVKTNIERAQKLIEKASKILSQDETPEPSKNCKYCYWAKGIPGL